MPLGEILDWDIVGSVTYSQAHSHSFNVTFYTDECMLKCTLNVQGGVSWFGTRPAGLAAGEEARLGVTGTWNQIHPQSPARRRTALGAGESRMTG